MKCGDVVTFNSEVLGVQPDLIRLTVLDSHGREGVVTVTLGYFNKKGNYKIIKDVLSVCLITLDSAKEK